MPSRPILPAQPNRLRFQAIPLYEAKRRIRAAVEEMAGEPDDFVLRAVHMTGVAMDTQMQNLFPAIWASASLKIGPWFILPKGILSSVLPLFSWGLQPFQEGKQKLHDLSQQLCETNREIFTQLMTRYYFLKTCGKHPEAWRHLDHDQPHALNALYQRLFDQKSLEKQPLSPEEKQFLYEADLALEQKTVVEPRIQRIIQALDWPFIQKLLKKPKIQLPFFPGHKRIRFHNFFDLADRMRWGMKAFDLARQVSVEQIQKRIVEAMAHHVDGSAGYVDSYSLFSSPDISHLGSPLAMIQAAKAETQEKMARLQLDIT